MRVQLKPEFKAQARVKVAPRRRRRGFWLAAVLTVAGWPATATADDRVDLTTTWYQESRQGEHGGLTVIHPQLDVGIDAGDHVTIDVGYAADAVSGATAAVYSVDAISTATPFSDLRHEGSLGLTFRGRRSRLGLSVRSGLERDYVSLSIGGHASIDLPGKNTTIGLAYSHGRDRVCDRDNALASPLQRRALSGEDPCEHTWILTDATPGMTLWQPVSIDTAQATVTQNLSPTMNLQLSAFGQIQSGFLSNPYRRVRIGTAEPQEHIPDVRSRLAVTARLNRFLPRLKSAFHFDARGYSDTWGVNAGSFEMAYSQYVGSSVIFRIHGRFHQQTAATFFKDAFFYQTESTAGSYFTGDRELAPVRNIVIGAKFSVLSVAGEKKVWTLFEKLQVNIKGDMYLLSELAADREADNLEGRGRQFLTAGQKIDAVVVQVGLLADY
jgi:hypothetical protein